MTLLTIGMAVFIGVHLVPSLAGWRTGLVARLGFGRYKVLFSVVSAIGLALIVIGKAQAPFIALWTPPAWGRHAAMGLMPIAFILLAAAYLPSNIKRLTAHPMLWGVLLWAAAHLAANGDAASLLLFGGFGAFAAFDMWSANRRGARPAASPMPVSRDALAIIAGLILYGALLALHPYLFGVAVMRLGS